MLGQLGVGQPMEKRQGNGLALLGGQTLQAGENTFNRRTLHQALENATHSLCCAFVGNHELVLQESTLAIQTIPVADKPGSKDSPLLKRFEGSLIVAYEYKNFAAFTVPLANQ